MGAQLGKEIGNKLGCIILGYSLIGIMIVEEIGALLNKRQW
jgi:hypothetical protein